MVLGDVISGKLPSQNVIIEDVSEVPGRHLILAFLHSLCQRCDQVLLLAYERQPHFFVNALPAALRNKVTLCASLPRAPAVGERLATGPTVAAVLGGIRGSNQRVGVVMDSLTPLVCSHSATAVPQLLKSLVDYKENGNKVEQVVSLLHRDVHDAGVGRVVCSGPTSLVQLQPPSSPHHRYGCLLTHGDPFKAPTQYTEDFNISNDFISVVDVTAVTKTTAKVKVADPETQADPTADLTFNLSLKPAEKAAKDQVILPYTQLSSPGSQGGHIHYVPDDADDFDDEDPDEDLEF